MAMVNYINDLLSEEEFLNKVYARSKSVDSKNASQAAINNLKYFCKDTYKKEADSILKDLQNDMKSTQNPAKVLAFLDKFVLWMQEDHQTS